MQTSTNQSNFDHNFHKKKVWFSLELRPDKLSRKIEHQLILPNLSVTRNSLSIASLMHLYSGKPFFLLLFCDVNFFEYFLQPTKGNNSRAKKVVLSHNYQRNRSSQNRKTVKFYMQSKKRSLSRHWYWFAFGSLLVFLSRRLWSGKTFPAREKQPPWRCEVFVFFAFDSFARVFMREGGVWNFRPPSRNPRDFYLVVRCVCNDGVSNVIYDCYYRR